jgi:adenosylhomocysteine nucleosidase
MIGIICALPEEVLSFLDARAGSRDPTPEFVVTKIGGCDAVVASSGLGKVRAAMTATVLIERWQCRALVSAGTAGGLGDVEPMHVVIASEIVQHDYGRSRGAGELELYRPGIPPLPEYRDVDFRMTAPADRLRRYREITDAIDFVEYATYASGDTFVNDHDTRERLQGLGATAVDMESAAVAQVAEYHELPWLVAKGISDAASATSHEDFLAGLAEASGRSAAVVTALLPTLLESCTTMVPDR